MHPLALVWPLSQGRQLRIIRVPDSKHTAKRRLFVMQLQIRIPRVQLSERVFESQSNDLFCEAFLTHAPSRSSNQMLKTPAATGSKGPVVYVYHEYCDLAAANNVRSLLKVTVTLGCNCTCAQLQLQVWAARRSCALRVAGPRGTAGRLAGALPRHPKFRDQFGPNRDGSRQQL
jgi:hypothetical protein